MTEHRESIVRDIDTINSLLDQVADDITLANNNLEIIHGLVSRVEFTLYEEENNEKSSGSN